MLREGSGGAPSLAKVAFWVQSAPHLSARAVRYALVGLGNGVVFSGTAAFAVSILHMSPVVASALGYLCSVPLSFIGHRSFTFRSQNAWQGEAGRFLLVHSCCLAASVLIMSTVTGMGLPYYQGLAGAVLLVPIINFLVSNFWVFAKRLRGEP
jgi:putative flippase GtrA